MLSEVFTPFSIVPDTLSSLDKPGQEFRRNAHYVRVPEDASIRGQPHIQYILLLM